ncbi:uncharacterized protein LOC108664480 [Hyalella azteca]|uniref:Uncharacterized protein LOC108664480 n=1 Tax=Hyalella azteca TaxID=294128 RepID=A0A8B7MYB6_HYAAZ|nr:uncharacterized protein LOC108664480 [Hyalella azteca]
MVACMDHVTALGACPDTAPPLYMCLKCKEQLEKNQSNVELQDVLKPMTNIATSCENKCHVIQDLFCVIAHGTPGSRIPAANLLFYYWPNLNPKLFDRKGMPIKLSEPVPSSGNESSPGFSDEEEDGKRKGGNKDLRQSDPDLVLTCYVLMLDIAYKQMEVQNVTKHQPITSGISTTMWQLLNKMLRTPYLISHECRHECSLCFLINTFFQLCTEIVTYLCPKLPVVNSRVADILKSVDAGADKSKTDAAQANVADAPKTCVAKAASPTPAAAVSSSATNGAANGASPTALPQVVTATVATVSAMDVVAHMPQEQVMAAVATATTCTEEEAERSQANATAVVATASVVGEDDEPVVTTQPLEEDEDVWVTSQGNFKFKLEDLPAQLQVVYALLERLSRISDGDEVYHICLCLKYLVLHGEAFTQTAHQHRGMLLWCQENITIHT